MYIRKKELVYQDNEYNYFLPCTKSDSIYINYGKYFNGEEVNFSLKKSLEREMIDINILEKELNLSKIKIE